MKRLFYLSILAMMGLLPIATSCGESNADNEAQIEAESQEAIKAESERAEQLEKDHLEAEPEAKKWKGASSMSEFKSKLPGTIWGATRKRGDFYFKFQITDNQIIITTHIDRNLSADSQFGEPMVEIIDSWKDLDGQNAFTVTAYQAGVDKDDWSTIPTMLAFRKGQPGAQWTTIDGVIPLKQIIE